MGIEQGHDCESLVIQSDYNISVDSTSALSAVLSAVYSSLGGISSKLWLQYQHAQRSSDAFEALTLSYRE